MPTHRALALVFLVAAGCSRSGGTRENEAGAGDASASAGDASAGDASAAPSTPASAAATPTAPPPPSADVRARARASAVTGSGLEARRSSVTHVPADPVLSAHAEALRKQHGGALPASLAVQTADLDAERRRVLLVGAERKDGTVEGPMVLVVDEKGALVWSKDRPAAGITAPIGPSAVASGPQGRIALAVCDPPTSLVALRLWDADGSPFADFQALETKACDAISLLYWPGHGWLIAIAAGSEIRVQMVTDAGALAWGQGRVLGARFRTIAPATLAVDSPTSFVLVQYAQSPGVDRDVDHALAYRYDANAQPMWPAPVDLGAVRRVAPGQERITLSKTSDGVLRAQLVGSTIVELRSNGETRRVP